MTARWNGDQDELLKLAFPMLNKLIMWYLHQLLKVQAWAQGMGRHTTEEIAHIAEQDVRAISVFLGKCLF